jgi:hypothetical protein
MNKECHFYNFWPAIGNWQSILLFVIGLQLAFTHSLNRSMPHGPLLEKSYFPLLLPRPYYLLDPSLSAVCLLRLLGKMLLHFYEVFFRNFLYLILVNKKNIRYSKWLMATATNYDL